MKGEDKKESNMDDEIPRRPRRTSRKGGDTSSDPVAKSNNETIQATHSNAIQNKSPKTKQHNDVQNLSQNDAVPSNIGLADADKKYKNDKGSIKVPLETVENIVTKKILPKKKQSENDMTVHQEKKLVLQKEEMAVLNKGKETIQIEKSPKKNIRKNEKFILSNTENDQKVTETEKTKNQRRN